MLALYLLAGTLASPDKPPAAAKAVVRIERSATVRAEDWSIAPPQRKREIHRIDESGRLIIVRLTEYQ